MTLNLWKKIVLESKDLGIKLLDLCGFGDVFLDRNLFEKIAFAKSIHPDFQVFLSTTGIAMGNKWHDDIIKYAD
ncbi:hypothetical protein ACQZV8_20525, partial [Magnetococcales bacterium HHB-1]